MCPPLSKFVFATVFSQTRNKRRSGAKREMYTYLSFGQTIKAVMDSQHGVTLDDAHPDCRTDGSVHTSAGSTDVHDCHIDVALVSTSKTVKG